MDLTGTPEIPPGSLAAYYHSLLASGASPLPGTPGTFWERHESVSMTRFPGIVMPAPSAKELRSVFWQGPAAVAEYLAYPTPKHPANSMLYLMEREDLPLQLSSEARRNIRKAERELTFEFVDKATLRAKGLKAYCENRQRNGLSDGTPEGFESHARSFDAVGHQTIGAWREGELVAYMTLIVIDGIVMLAGFSSTEARVFRPNDGLIAAVVDYYLAGDRCHMLNYGLASLQAAGGAEGLHRFKLNVGFRAEPVCRRFVVHPALRPGVNTVTLRSAEKLSSVFPKSRPVRKAAGVLRLILSPT